MSCIGGGSQRERRKNSGSYICTCRTEAVEFSQLHNIDSLHQRFAKDMPKHGKNNDSARARTGDRLCVRQK